MSKIIQDIVVEPNVQHQKFDKQAEMWAHWQEEGLSYYKNMAREKNDKFDPNFEIGDLAWGYKFNNEIVQGILKQMDPQDPQGLYYLIEGEYQSGWCSKIELVSYLEKVNKKKSLELEEFDPNHFGSF